MNFQEDFLIRKAQKGDPEAFIKLFERYKMSLYKTALCYLKHDCDIADAMQDTALSAWEKLPDLKESSYFKTWLTRILINKCNDILRQSIRVIPVERFDEEQEAPPDNTAFYELLEELPEDHRTIFYLYYGEGFKTKEIAKILNMNENTVKSRLSRGRAKLAESLT